ncbi:MAG: entericidin [Pseudomonadota bacterium]
MRAPIRMTLCLALVLGLSACETTKGFIRDAENVGSALAGGG